MTKTILSGLPVHTLAALGLLLSTTTTAQVLPQYDSLGAHVPTGILLDRSSFYVTSDSSAFNVHLHNGVQDTGVHWTDYSRILSILHEASYDKVNFELPSDSIYDRYERTAYGQSLSGLSISQQMAIPRVSDLVLGYIDMEVNTLSNDGFLYGYYYFDETDSVFRLNDQGFQYVDTLYLDSLGITNIPPGSIMVTDTTFNPSYQEALSGTFDMHEVFLLASLDKTVYVEDLFNIAIALPPDLILSNNGQTGHTEIDLDDGLGYRPIHGPGFVNGLTLVSYATEGEKTIRIRRPSPYQDGAFIKSSVSVKVRELPFGPPNEVDIFGLGTLPCGITPPFGMGEGMATYLLQDGSNVRKPFVVVEGFDRSPRGKLKDQINDPRHTTHGFGGINFESFTTGDFEGRADWMAKSRDFVDLLINEGDYDVIFVDFRTNGAEIEKNGYALIDFITNDLQLRLNAANSDEQIRMVGISMGGLITRFALNTLEQAGCCHDVVLHGTFSTPHRGAHIPLGIQHLFNELGHNQLATWERGKDARTTFDKVLSCPAAKQMLVHHINGGQAHAQLMQTLQAGGHPEELLSIALTNGSATSIGQNDNGDFLQENELLVKAEKIIKIVKGTSPPLSYVTEWPVMRGEAYADKTQGPNGNTLVLDRTGHAFYHLAWGASHLIMIVVALVLAVIAIIALGVLLPFSSVLFAPGIVAMKLIPAVIDGAIHDATFDMSSNHDRYITGTHQAQDHIPGDLVPTQRRMKEEVGSDIIEYDIAHHSFVATVSALDMDTSDLWIHVRNEWDLNDVTGLIPFDHIWFPGISGGPSPNQEHVRITDGNISWIMSTLDAVEADPSGPQPGLQVLAANESFNYGQPADGNNVPPLRHIGSIEVLGQLKVNETGALYRGGTFGNTAANSDFTLRTANINCTPPYIRIDNGGELRVGDAQGNNTATLRIRQGAVLDLRGGSTLRVYAGSKVVIEPGGELIIGPNATIELLSTDARLVLEGKVSIEDGAEFHFDGAGEIVYRASDSVPYEERWAYGANSTMYLHGSGQSDVVLRIEDGTFGFRNQSLPQLNDFGGLTVYQGQIVIDNGLYISHDAPLDLEDVLIDKAGSQRHGGLYLWGQNNVSLHNCDIENGEYGIKANLTTYGYDLSLWTSEISNCGTGIWLHGKSVDMRYCRVHDCDNEGLYAEDMDGTSRIGNSDLYQNQQGVKFHGQTGTELQLHKNDVYDNTYGVEIVEASATLTCNTIEDQSNFGLRSELGSLYMNNDAGNIIQNNGTVNIEIDECYEFQLAGGNNIFSNTSSTGLLLAGCFSGQATGLSGASLDATGNLPATVSGTQVSLTSCPDNSAITLLLDNTYVTSSCYGIIINPPDWDDISTEKISGLLQSSTSNQLISTSLISSELLPVAIENTLPYLKHDSLGGDLLLAIDRFDEILSYSYTGLTATDRELLNLSFKLMVQAYGMALDYELVPRNRAVENASENSYLQKIGNYISAAIQDVDLSDPQASHLLFKLELDRAHVYRMSEHYDYAFTALTAAAGHADPEEIFRTDYWDCVCTAEEALLQGETAPEDFHTDIENCQSHLPQPRSLFGVDWQPTPVRSVGRFQVALSPNPTARASVLSWKGVKGKGSVRIRDMAGRLVGHMALDEQSSAVRLSREGLASGTYLLTLRVGDSEQTVQWMVR